MYHYYSFPEIVFSGVFIDVHLTFAGVNVTAQLVHI